MGGGGLQPFPPTLQPANSVSYSIKDDQIAPAPPNPPRPAPGKTVLTPVCRKHPPVLRKEFTVICAMRHPVAPAQQVRHGANEVRSWLS